MTTGGVARSLLDALNGRGAAPVQRWAGEGSRWNQRRGSELRSDVLRLAAGLRSLGVEPGERVGLVADGGPHWLEADLAILALGAVDVPRGTDTTALELARILDHAGVHRCLCVGEAAVQRVRAASRLPGGKPWPVVRVDREGDAGEDGLSRDGLDALAGRPLDVTHLPEVGEDAPATLVYTSGTTGHPKGVTLLHGNLLHQLRVLPEALDFREGDVFLSMLPPWHAYERITEYVAALSGGEVAFTDPRSLRDHLARVRPTWMATVPRVWEMILSLSGYTTLRRRDPGRAAATLRGALGGNLRVGVSGGGSLPATVDACYLEAGVDLLVGYGLTETAPVLTVRRPGTNRPGTIGGPVGETELRIVDRVSGNPVAAGGTGVLLARGPQVMAGYWREPELTARVLGEDRWFDTGDLVSMAEDGDLVFRGRAKETLVLRGGVNVEPGPLEDRLRESPLVDQVVVLGQDRKVLGALVVPSAEAGRAEDGTAPAARGRLEARLLEEFQRLLTEEAGFPAHQRIHRVLLAEEPFTVENGLLTATHKVRRGPVEARYGEAIEGLFR